jgi:hypothetical protein
MQHSPICDMDRISDAIDGLLNENEMEAFHRHLGTCAECSKAYDELLQVSSRLHSLPSLDAPSDLVAVIRRTIHAKVSVQLKGERASQQGWFSLFSLYPWRTLTFVGAFYFIAILALQLSSDTTTDQPCLIALELRADEEVAGLDLELGLSKEGIEAGKPTVPTGLGDFIVAAHSHGPKMRVSMASAQAIRPSGETRILELPLTQRAGSACMTDAIQILSVRAYRTDGTPAHAEIIATPMLPTRDSKLNTTA